MKGSASQAKYTEALFGTLVGHMKLRRRSLAAAALASALWILTGCSSAPQPYSRGQVIPLGPYTVRVTYVAMKAFQGVDSLAVYLHIAEVRTSDDATRMAASLMTRMALRDGAGRKTRGFLLSARNFEMASLNSQDFRSPGVSRMLEDSLFAEGDPSAWVAVFPVSPRSQGFTLLLSNPGRREGQPRSVAVDLGR